MKTFEENQTGLLHQHDRTQRTETVKPEMFSGRTRRATFTVIMLNPESNSMCREKRQSEFHCDTLTFRGLQIRPWMYCWNAVLTTIGTLMGTENYPMHGQDLHGLPSWTKDLQTVIPGPGGASQKDEQHPCQVTCGQKCGQICQTLLNNEKSKSGLSKTETRQCVKTTRTLLR